MKLLSVSTDLFRAVSQSQSHDHNEVFVLRPLQNWTAALNT